VGGGVPAGEAALWGQAGEADQLTSHSTTSVSDTSGAAKVSTVPSGNDMIWCGCHGAASGGAAHADRLCCPACAAAGARITCKRRHAGQAWSSAEWSQSHKQVCVRCECLLAASRKIGDDLEHARAMRP
jgi:hypothetical protein